MPEQVIYGEYSDHGYTVTTHRSITLNYTFDIAQIPMCYMRYSVERRIWGKALSWAIIGCIWQTSVSQVGNIAWDCGSSIALSQSAGSPGLAELIIPQQFGDGLMDIHLEDMISSTELWVAYWNLNLPALEVDRLNILL